MAAVGRRSGHLNAANAWAECRFFAGWSRLILFRLSGAHHAERAERDGYFALAVILLRAFSTRTGFVARDRQKPYNPQGFWIGQTF